MSTPTNAQTLPADWLCDCKDSEIRWVDETRPHVAATGPGWICTGCLAEFLPADSLKGLEQERDRLRLIARELLADLRIVIDVARQNLPRAHGTIEGIAARLEAKSAWLKGS
jgi:hypothetical protein